MNNPTRDGEHFVAVITIHHVKSGASSMTARPEPKEVVRLAITAETLESLVNRSKSHLDLVDGS